MPTIKPVLRKDSISKDQSKIYLCVTFGNVRKYHSMGISVKNKNFNPKTGLVRSGVSDYKNINALLLQKISEANILFLRLEAENNLYLEPFLNEFLNKKATAQSSLYTFIEKEIDLRKSRMSQSTVKKYKSLINKLKTYKGESLLLHQIDHEFLDKFEAWLNSRMTHNGAHHLLKTLRTFIRIAHKKEIIKKYPFNDFKVSFQESTRTFLSENELKRIIDIQLPEGMARVRDMFVIQCYTGLRFSDLQALTNDHFVQQITTSGGKKEYSMMIHLTMQKTGKLVTIPLIRQACVILDKFQERDRPEHLFFKRISNQKYNDALHKIERKLELSKPLTSHVARHTFATLALSKGIPIETVSAILGHKNIRETQIYGKIINDTKVQEMKKFVIL